MIEPRMQETSAWLKLAFALVAYVIYVVVAEVTANLGCWKILIHASLVLLIVMASAWALKTGYLLVPRSQTKAQMKTGRYFLVFIILYFGYFFQILSGVYSALGLEVGKLVRVTVVALGAGFFEEFLVRGLILGAFAQLLEGKRGQISISVFSSALIFGLLHFCNLTYQTFPATLQQVIYAAVIGVALGVVRVVTNGLVLPVILHSLIDFKPDVLEASELMNWSMLTLILVPLLVVASITLINWEFKRNYLLK